MWKALLTGAAALAIGGGSFVYAQQRDNAPVRSRGAESPQSRALTQEDRAAFTDARLAALKAGLRLTPEQEKLWPPFEAALRDIAKARLERSAARPDRSGASDPVAELRRQAEILTTAGANLTRLADAQAPLYESFDDSQKNRFRLLSRILASRHPHFAQERRRGGHGARP